MKKLFSVTLALGVLAATLAIASPAAYAHGCHGGGGHYGYHDGYGCPYNNSDDCPYYSNRR